MHGQPHWLRDVMAPGPADDQHPTLAMPSQEEMDRRVMNQGLVRASLTRRSQNRLQEVSAFTGSEGLHQLKLPFLSQRIGRTVSVTSKRRQDRNHPSARKLCNFLAQRPDLCKLSVLVAPPFRRPHVEDRCTAVCLGRHISKVRLARPQACS